MVDKKLIGTLFDMENARDSYHAECREGGIIYLNSNSTNSTEHLVGDDCLDDSNNSGKPREEVEDQRNFILDGRSLEKIFMDHPEALADIGLAYKELEELGFQTCLVYVEKIAAPFSVWMSVVKDLARKKGVALLIENPEENEYLLRFLDEKEEELLTHLANWIKDNYAMWVWDDKYMDRFDIIDPDRPTDD